jgi:L-methionine (R)-S-oxide reductase
MLVEDLNDFPGPITGDSTSRSALAVPLIESGECLGVLALDSEQVGRFDEDDKEGCEALAGLFLAHQRALGIGPAPSAIRRRGTH